MPLIPALLALLALPLLEIGVFIWVGGAIGIGPTLLLVIASVVLGSVLLRRQTLSTLRGAQAEARAGRVPGREIVHGAMIAVAGILLMLPGFVTDVIGLLLFLPPVRDFVWRQLRSRVVVVGPGGRAAGGGAPRRPAGPEVIDLSGGEFRRRDGEPDSPWTAIDDPNDDRGPRTLH